MKRFQELESVINFKKKFLTIYEEHNFDSFDISKELCVKLTELKSIYVRKQMYEIAADLRSIERDMIEILNDDKLIFVNLLQTIDIINMLKFGIGYDNFDDIKEQLIDQGITEFIYKHGTGEIICYIKDGKMIYVSDSIKNISELKEKYTLL